MMVVPRVVLAFTAKRPGPVAGSAAIEHFLANASHVALYACMVVLPTSGILMGYFGKWPTLAYRSSQNKGLSSIGTSNIGVTLSMRIPRCIRCLGRTRVQG